MKRAKTPLMQMLLQAFTQSASDEQLQASRRKFIKQALLGAGALAVGGTLLESCAKKTSEVAILGAGIAGLHCAWLLKKAGIPYSLYEGSKRAGGRMYSAKNLTGEGIVTELGAEFIDSDHEDILALAREFKLELLDMEKETQLEKYLFYFGGKKYSCTDLQKAFAPFAESIQKDIDSLPEVMRYDNYGPIKPWDDMSIIQYLESKNMKGWLLNLFDVAFTTEYGLDASEQSAINMLFLFDSSLPKCSLFGDSDERYKIVGGNQRITDELASRVGEIHYEHMVNSITDHADRQYEIGFGNGKKVKADYIICTIPFSILRTVDLQLRELTPVKRKCISELGYGRNAKTFAGFKKSIWSEMGSAGQIFTDKRLQLGWEHSQLQNTAEFGYTFFTGGSKTDIMKGIPVEEKVKIYNEELDKIFPGTVAQYNGKNGQFFWPDYPFVKASYACYKVGQWTSIAGAEQEPCGNILFAGEHCSYDYQGFMNGGAETGRVAAESLLLKMKEPG